MVGVGPLDPLPIWAVFVLTFGFCIVAYEVGFWIGTRRRGRREGADDPTGGLMVGATLALMAFFLAFLVGLTLDRFDTRRAMVTDEANAIGTTWLRAGYLAEPYPATIRPILEEYVDTRLDLVDDELRAAALARSNELLGDLWEETEALVRGDPDSESVALFVETVNDTIDMAAKREVALVTWRLPWTLWLAAYVIAGASMLMIGYHSGLIARRNTPSLILLALVFAATMNLIVDLDRPYDGVLQVNQEALTELREQVRAP